VPETLDSLCVTARHVAAHRRGVVAATTCVSEPAAGGPGRGVKPGDAAGETSSSASTPSFFHPSHPRFSASYCVHQEEGNAIVIFNMARMCLSSFKVCQVSASVWSRPVQPQATPCFTCPATRHKEPVNHLIAAHEASHLLAMLRRNQRDAKAVICQAFWVSVDVALAHEASEPDRRRQCRCQ